MKTLLLLSALLCQDKPFPDAEPWPLIDAAHKQAAKENRTVLVLWGLNDSEESRAAAALLKSDKGLKKLLQYEYDLVLADAAKAGESIAKEIELSKLPLIWVLGEDATAKHYFYANPVDAKRWTEILEKHKRPPLIAKDVLAAGLKKAAAEKKRVLLTFGAPW